MLKMTVHNEQGEEVDLEVTLPAIFSSGVYTFSFKFPNDKYATVTFDKWELRALLSQLVETL